MSRRAALFVFLGFASLAGGSAPLRAQASRVEAPAAILRLSDAVRQALSADPDVLLAEAQVIRARGERASAGLRVPSNPLLTASIASDRPYAGTGEESRDVQLTQEFWAPGQRAARIAASDAGLAAAEHARTWAKRRAAADAAIAHARLGAAQRKEAVLQELTELLRRVDTMSEKRETMGDLSEFARNQVRMETAQALAEMARLRTETIVVREDLARRMGTSLDDDLTLEATPEPLPWATFVSMISPAMPRERPDVSAAAQQVMRAEGLWAVEKRERRPRPTVFVGWQKERSVLLGDDFVGFPFATDGLAIRDADRSLVVGFAIAIPIFDRNRGGIMRALGDRMVADAEFARTERGAESELRQILGQGRLLAEADEALASALDSATSNFEIAQRAWEGGQIGLTELLRERDRILRSRLTSLDVRVGLVETELRLAALSADLSLFGILVDEDESAGTTR